MDPISQLGLYLAKAAMDEAGDPKGLYGQLRPEMTPRSFSEVKDGKALSSIVGNWLGSQNPERSPERINTWPNVYNIMGMFARSRPNEIGVNESHFIRNNVGTIWPQKVEHAAAGTGTIANELTHFHQNNDRNAIETDSPQLTPGEWMARFSHIDPTVSDDSSTKYDRAIAESKFPENQQFFKSAKAIEAQSSVVDQLAQWVKQAMIREGNQPAGTRPR